jgi:hypothetical protein
MVHLLKSSIILLIFSASIFIFSISCEKEADAQTTDNTSVQNLGVLFFLKKDHVNGEIWKSNYDGSNQVKIIINSFPTSSDIDDDSDFKISPDGKKIFFVIRNMVTSKSSMYSCNIDGTGLIMLVDDVVEMTQAI